MTDKKESSIWGAMERDPSDLNPAVWGEPDPDFDPVRNRKIMESVARNNLENRNRKRKEYKKNLEGRTDAMSYYLTSDKYRYNKNPWREGLLNEYFGKRTLAKIRGQQWVDALRSASDDIITAKEWEGIKKRQGGVNIRDSASKNSVILPKSAQNKE